jgi:hypothetical protein
MEFITVPSIITQDIFPAIHSINVPGQMINNSYDTFPFPYKYNDMPNTLTQGIDPQYQSIPQRYEYRYTNPNNIDVIIRGTYDDVMSVIDVLKVYPPKKTDCDGRNKRFDIFSNIPSRSSTVPDFALQYSGKYLLIRIADKIYSGTGSLIMVVQKGKPLTDAGFVLFKDVKSNQYQDLGGKIDKPSKPIENIDKTILFENAAKETIEESMKLFVLNTVSDVWTDIEAEDTNTFYRIYLYVFEMDDPSNLATYYDQNKMNILATYPANYDESYRETDKLDLFDYQSFIKKLQNYGMGVTNISVGTFQTVAGRQVSVRGRTMKGIAQFYRDGAFTRIKPSVATIRPAVATTDSNVITI